MQYIIIVVAAYDALSKAYTYLFIYLFIRKRKLVLTQKATANWLKKWQAGK